MDELNLVDKVKSGFTPEVVARIGSFVGESPGKTQQVIGEAVPSIFTGLAEKASSDTGAKDLYDMAKESSAAKTGVAEAVSEKGQGMMSKLFGDRTALVTDRVARQAGVSTGAASKIMGLVGPAILGFLGKEIVSRGMGVSGLANLLTGQRPALATPTGTSWQERDRPDARANARVGSVPMGERAGVRPKRGWLPLLLFAALAVMATWFLLSRGRHRTVEPRVRAPIPAAPAEPRAVAPAPTLPAETPAVPSAAPLMAAPAPMGASGEALTAYLADSTAELPKRFAIDGLNFAFGSATVASPPLAIDSITAALKAHPTARIRLDGYTDIIGSNTEQDQALSLSRAEATRALLVNKGIDESRILAAGHGSSSPVATNDTDEGRAQNRRVELVVLSR